jgi:hypothetical protein
LKSFQFFNLACFGGCCFALSCFPSRQIYLVCLSLFHYFRLCVFSAILQAFWHFYLLQAYFYFIRLSYLFPVTWSCHKLLHVYTPWIGTWKLLKLSFFSLILEQILFVITLNIIGNTALCDSWSGFEPCWLSLIYLNTIYTYLYYVTTLY